MKKLNLLFILVLAFSSFTTLFAQIDVTSTGGVSPASYTTLGAAFTAINTGTHTGQIAISVSGNTTELTTASLDSSGNPTGSSYTSIAISTTNAWTIGGALASPLVTLNGADNVSINGLFGGISALAFYNSTATGNTLKLINDASTNHFTSTVFRGMATTTNAGVVWLSTGLNTGNDNNVFDACNFDGNFGAYSLMTSNGTATSSVIENSGDTVKNCNFFNNNPTVGASPVTMWLINGTDWHIKSNSFYFTTPIILVAQGVYSAIIAYPNWTTDQHHIEGNFIGGSGPGCIGLMSISGTGTNVAGFNGMYIQVGGGSVIENNIIKNVSVSVTSAAGSFTNWGIGTYIGGYNGTMTLSGNEVSNITGTNTLQNFILIGVSTEARTVASGTITPSYTVSNNTISTLTAIGGGAGTAAQCTGYRALTSSAASLTAAAICNPTYTVSSNSILNLSATLAAANTLCRGIVSANTAGTAASPLRPRMRVLNNTIGNLNSNGILASYTGPTACGMFFFGATASVNANDTNVVTGNTISGLNSTNTGDLNTTSMGILGAAGRYKVSQNKIYGLTNAGLGSTNRPGIVGVNIVSQTSASEISNNYVSLGEGNSTNIQVLGLMSNSSSIQALNFYYNSVYISGVGTGGNTRNSACLYRGTEAFVATTTPFFINNNLLVNTRTGGTGFNVALGTAGTGTWTSNYNALLSSASTIGLWSNVTSDFTTFQASSANDASSVSAITGVTSDYTVNPNVVSTTDLFNNGSPATTGILDIKTANTAAWLVNGKGNAIASISTDIYGTARSVTAGTATDIGAYEFTPSSTPPAMVEAGSFSNGGTTTYSSFGKNVMSVLWNNVGTIATRSATFFPGTTPPGTLDPLGRNSNGYWQMDVNGGASGYNYDITLNYDPAMMGTTVNTNRLRIGKRETPSGDWNIITSTPDTVAMIITGPGLTSFSQFALTDQDFPMPVELSSFTANTDRNKVTLNWSTVSELNNSGFDIERKNVSTVQWSKVGSVAGNGTINTISNYSFTENNVATGKYNYRLKQVDFNGNFQYYDLSSEVTVGVPTKFALGQNYPNPFNPSTKINYELPFDSKVSIKIFDITGRQMTSLVNQIQTAGYHTVDFNALNLSSGTYFYTITAEGGNQNYVKTLKMMLIK